MTNVPRFVVLGGPVPEALQEGLGGLVQVMGEGEIAEHEADGVLLYAAGDVFPALRRFRAKGGLLPIFGWSTEPVDIEARLRWVREGGDDLLEPDTAVDVLVERIRGDTRHIVTEADTGLRIDRYLAALRRYVAAREELIGVLGAGGRSRYIDATFLRDQVLRASDVEAPTDAFGHRRGGEREQLDWPIDVRLPRPGPGELRNIGSDGLCLAVASPPGPGEVLEIALEGLASSAVLAVEVRWQRRSARDRWEAGVLVIGIRVDPAG